jgi:hypothetical protein
VAAAAPVAGAVDLLRALEAMFAHAVLQRCAVPQVVPVERACPGRPGARIGAGKNFKNSSRLNK